MRASRLVEVHATDQGTHVSLYSKLAELQRQARDATGSEAKRFNEQIIEEKRRISFLRQSKGATSAGKKPDFHFLADYFLPEYTQSNYTPFSTKNQRLII